MGEAGQPILPNNGDASIPSLDFKYPSSILLNVWAPSLSLSVRKIVCNLQNCFTFEIKKKLPTLKPFINQMVNKANSKNKIFTKAKYVAFLWHNYFQAFAKPIQLNFFRNPLARRELLKSNKCGFSSWYSNKTTPTIEILQEMHFAVVANIYTTGRTEHNTFECEHTYMQVKICHKSQNPDLCKIFLGSCKIFNN